MAKDKIAYVCDNCGQESAKWIGRCPNCGQWNTFKQIRIAPDVGVSSAKTLVSHTFGAMKQNVPQALREVSSTEEIRVDMKDSELNRVLGGGLVVGSMVLIGGEPGIGKSTLTLQTLLSSDRRVLYVSGEESPQQIKMRALRISDTIPENIVILSETSIEKIFNSIKEVKPELLVIDSIQTVATETVASSAGSISQIRESAAALLQLAKSSDIPVILIGHINKEGSIAGPKVLEHIVDTVLQFEGDQHYMYRILRSIKNRFGSTSELGIYEMLSNGLREVNNPSEILISKTDETISGTSIAATLEGMRPLMIEIQALVSTAVYGTPQRSTTGFNAKRLNMLLAVLEKRAGFRLGAKDVFLNITGGISIDDPAADLGVAMAILSSNEDIAIEKDVCFAGEVGLGGEIRPVQRVEQRITEAEKLGFNTIFVSKYNKIALKNTKIKVITVAKIEDAIQELFG